MQPVSLSCLFLQKTVFSDFPGNIWVASFMLSAFQGSTILQSGVYLVNWKFIKMVNKSP